MIGHTLRFWTVAHPNAQMWLCVAGLMSEPREWYVYKARSVEEIMEFLTFQYFAEPSHNRTTLSNRPSAMAYLKLTSFWVVLSLAVVTLAQLESPLQSLHLNNVEKRQLESQDTLGLQKRCVGDCVTCFGAGYQKCASNSYICFKPGDAEHGEDTCTGSFDITNFTLPSVPTFDFCYKGDCQTCFGSGYQLCPDSSTNCYKPGDSQHGLDSCSSSSGSDSGNSAPSSGSSAPTTTSSSTPESDDTTSSPGSDTTTTDFCNNGGFDCKRCFGNTYIPCPDSSQYASNSYCYDPNNSTSVCPDGTSPAPGTGSSGTGPSGSDSITSSGTASYTASVPSQTSGAQNSAGSASTAGAHSSGAGSGGSSYQPSVTFSGSKTSSATGSNQTGTFGNPSSSPASATTNGQPGAGEGMLGCMAVTALCFAVSFGVLF